MKNIFNIHKELGLKFFKIDIIPGYCGGGVFNIHPIRCIPQDGLIHGLDDVIMVKNLAISLDEDDRGDALHPLLLKYFDKTLKWNEMRDDCGYIYGFEWYLSDNFYTYQTMEIMLQDIG